MPLPHNNPTELGCWERLNALSQQLKQTTLANLFSADPGRARKLSIEWEDFFVDFSKHLVTDQVMGKLYE